MSDDRHSKLINRAVLDYIDFPICKLSLTKIPDIKDNYLVIMSSKKYIKPHFAEELQKYLREIIPLEIYVFISSGMDC
jgi:hypothetical protein